MGPGSANLVAQTALERCQLAVGSGRRMQDVVLLQSIRSFESFATMVTQIRSPLTVHITHMPHVMHLP